MIVLVVGDFGVGKDTFADMLLNELGDVSQKIKSYTTREPRYIGEDTHIFISQSEWIEMDNKVAETIIGDNYYGTTADQFKKEDGFFNIYVVDDIGVKYMQDANIDDIYLVEIIRPKWLIDVPVERLNRKRPDAYDYSQYVDFRIINDGSLDKLRATAKDIALWLKIHYKN